MTEDEFDEFLEAAMDMADFIDSNKDAFKTTSPIDTIDKEDPVRDMKLAVSGSLEKFEDLKKKFLKEEDSECMPDEKCDTI